MAIIDFRVKYRRPDKLSDPHDDFSAKHLKELLETPDAKLNSQHYKNLLGPFLPAGTYKESIYFLPGAFRYLLAHKKDALDLAPSVIWFVSEYHDFLRKDGILETARDCIRECLADWIKEFRVIHFDEKASRQKGWKLKYFDYVENTEVIGEATSDLVRFKSHADLAEEFVRDLAYHRDNPVKAAWFLEYSRSQTDVYSPPNYEPITRLINDDELLLKAAVLVEKQLVPKEQSPTYWPDTFKTIGLS